MNPITIIIPTYNRSGYLKVLLGNLVAEIENNNLEIRIIVSDNASTDNTNAVVDHFASSYSYIHSIRNNSNIGAEANFLAAIKVISSEYFWIIGDDDFPRYGILTMVCNLIYNFRPDAIYLPSLWSQDAINRSLPSISLDSFSHISAENLSKQVHVWSTYVSGWVINYKTLLCSNFTFEDSYNVIGSNLISLSWVLPLFNSHVDFIKVNETAIFATASNGGGYSLINTFAINYPMLVRRFVQSHKIKSNLINGFCLHFLPRLLATRHSTAYENMLIAPLKYTSIIRSLCTSLWFWFFCFPLLFIPRFVLIFFIKYLSRIRN